MNIWLLITFLESFDTNIFLVSFDTKKINVLKLSYKRTRRVEMFCYRCQKLIQEGQLTLSGLHDECFRDWFGITLGEEFSNIVARQAATSQSVFNNFNSSFFHGKFRK